MQRFIVARLLLMVPTFIAIAALIFLTIQLPPGDILTNEIAELQAQGDRAAAARIEFLRREHALDRSLVEQFGIWLGAWPGPRGFSGLLQGDLGPSFEFNKPVAEVVGYALGPTIAVNVLAVLTVYLLSIPLGVMAAVRQNGWADHLIAMLAYVAIATPGFLLALVVLTYSNSWFGVSIGGLIDPRFADRWWSAEGLLSMAAHGLVAVIVIAFSGVGAMTRRLRANVLDELNKPYVIAARARGISETRLLLRYPVRMALIPFVADIGNLLPSLISGSVIVSVVLSLPTVGPVLVRALQSQDLFLSGFILLFAAGLTLIGTLVSDLLLALIDPRVRLGKALDR
jgi:peptide/nickel transport system permease protein